MPAFSVNFEALLAAVDEMAAFDGRMEQTLARVTSSMESLSASWHGEASAQQQSAKLEWETGAEQLRAALAQLRAAAEQAHTNYADSAAMNTRMWS